MLVLRLILVVCLVSLPAFSAQDAGSLFRAGRKAEKSGRMAEAYLLYSQAAALAPQKSIYWLHSLAVRTRANTEAKTVPIPTPPTASPAQRESAAPSGLEELFQPLDPVTPTDIAQARKPLPPKHLNAQPGLKDFDLKGNARYLFEQVAKSYGLDCVFDSDYPTAGQPFPFRMEQTDYRDALHALEAATGSFIVPLSDRLFLVVKDTIQKRNEKEPAITLTVDIPNPVSIQEAQELAIAVRQALEIRRFGVDTVRRVIIMRDWISKVWPAQQLMQDLLAWRPEVAIDLELLEMSQTDALSYGMDITTQFPVVSFARVLNSLPSIPSTITRLALFGGGRTVFGIGLADATLIARMSNSDARSLMHATIRSLDGLPATFHVGDRYPIMSMGYFGRIETAGQVYRPPPSFNYEELGLKLKITPKVHGTEEVSLEVESEFKVLGGAGLNGIPIISERKFNSRVRLKNDEWGVVAGMVTSSEARTIAGLAGLSRLPLLGPLVRTNTRDRDSRVVLIVIKPRLLSLPPSEMLTRETRTGTETRPLTPL